MKWVVEILRQSINSPGKTMNDRVKVLFLHGWRSVVGGVKPTYLKDSGLLVFNPSLDDDDFDLALKVAQETFHAELPDVVVGSSRGGALAMNMSCGDVPLVLLCPAWKNWGHASSVGSNTIILHSPLDEVIPFSDSQELVENSSLPEENFVSVGHEHRLADQDSLKAMQRACLRLVGRFP